MRGEKFSEIETTCKGESTASSLIFYVCIIGCCYYARKDICHLCLGCAAENKCKFLVLLLSAFVGNNWYYEPLMSHRLLIAS